jgi:hypothetical protein
MFENASIDNINSWISGGGGLVFLSSLLWCRLKIRAQCDTISELKKEMKLKADDEDFKEMKKDNKEDHKAIFDKIDALPQKIIDLMK